MIAASGVIVWLGLSSNAGRSGEVGRAGRPAAEQALPATPLSLQDGTRRGNSDARVAVIEYSEFQCPFCRTFARNVFPTLLSSYVDTGKVLWVFRHFPLEDIHSAAFSAAEAASCAGLQGKFWDMHDKMFEAQRQLSADPAIFGTFASVVGLDLSSFGSCMEGSQAASVRRDLAGGSELGVRGTPTFFIGHVNGGKLTVTDRLMGANDPSEFGRVLDRLLKADVAAGR
jgi:protein-disulfide isomerase